MSTTFSVTFLLAINLGLVWLLMAAPLGQRTLRLHRKFEAEPMRVWSAVFPLGPHADWHHAVLSSQRIGSGRVRQALTHLDRRGQPIERVLEVRDVSAHAGTRMGFMTRVIDDSALDPSFWQHFQERRSVSAAAGGTLLTVEQSDRYRGVAFLLYRYFALRREIGALEQWLRRGRSEPNGLFERPVVQASLAILSTLLLWPFFGLDIHGLMLSTMLTMVIVLHELGHMAAYRAFGHRGVRMIFVPLLGGIAIGGRPYHSAYEIAFCALMGAGVSALLVPLVIVAERLLAQSSGAAAGFANPALVFLVILGAFNLLNLLPMHRFDGGQVLRQVFSSRQTLAMASFGVALAVLCVGWRIGLPAPALVAGLAVFTLLSLLGRGRSVRPRHALVPMTGNQRLLAGCGLYAAVVIHGYAIVHACDRLFG